MRAHDVHVVRHGEGVPCLRRGGWCLAVSICCLSITDQDGQHRRYDLAHEGYKGGRGTQVAEEFELETSLLHGQRASLQRTGHQWQQHCLYEPARQHNRQSLHHLCESILTAQWFACPMTPTNVRLDGVNPRTSSIEAANLLSVAESVPTSSHMADTAGSTRTRASDRLLIAVSSLACTRSRRGPSRDPLL